jgi:hypothetical protein
LLSAAHQRNETQHATTRNYLPRRGPAPLQCDHVV